MKQEKLLRRIINTPHVFANEEQRAVAKVNWFKKRARKWKREVKRIQLKLEI